MLNKQTINSAISTLERIKSMRCNVLEVCRSVSLRTYPSAKKLTLAKIDINDKDILAINTTLDKFESYVGGGLPLERARIYEALDSCILTYKFYLMREEMMLESKEYPPMPFEFRKFLTQTVSVPPSKMKQINKYI